MMTGRLQHWEHYELEKKFDSLGTQHWSEGS